MRHLIFFKRLLLRSCFCLLFCINNISIIVWIYNLTSSHESEKKIYITIQTNRRHQFNLWNVKSKTFISKKSSNIVVSQLETDSKIEYDGHEIVVAGMVETPTHSGATIGSFDRIVKEMSEAAELDVNVKRERKENKNRKENNFFEKPCQVSAQNRNW